MTSTDHFSGTASQRAKKVANHVTYTQDYVAFNNRFVANEYWQSPNETYRLGVGDCEDSALLVMSELLGDYRVELVVGDVDGGRLAVNHVWVAIWIAGKEWFIESTSGRLVTPAKYIGRELYRMVYVYGFILPRVSKGHNLRPVYPGFLSFTR